MMIIAYASLFVSVSIICMLYISEHCHRNLKQRALFFYRSQYNAFKAVPADSVLCAAASRAPLSDIRMLDTFY